MPTRADLDPAQAAQRMDAAQEMARRREDAVDAAQEVLDRLEDQLMNATSPDEAHGLQLRFNQAESNLEFAQQEFQEALDEIGSLSDFWYEEEIDPDEY